MSSSRWWSCWLTMLGTKSQTSLILQSNSMYMLNNHTWNWDKINNFLPIITRFIGLWRCVAWRMWPYIVDGNWQVQIQHMYREVNKSVNYLACVAFRDLLEPCGGFIWLQTYRVTLACFMGEIQPRFVVS